VRHYFSKHGGRLRILFIRKNRDVPASSLEKITYGSDDNGDGESSPYINVWIKDGKPFEIKPQKDNIQKMSDAINKARVGAKS
jgi:hypothetical protein